MTAFHDEKLITVIGGGGFVGRYVVEALLETRVRVRIAQRNPRQATKLCPLADMGYLHFVRCDVEDAASVERALHGSDAVINLAGSFDRMQQVQAEGAANIARAVEKLRIPTLVHQSAIGADANSPSLYGRSKAAGEEAVRRHCPQATIMRPSIIFGREDQFINRFAQMIRDLPIIPIVEGRAQFQPVYVQDVANAAVAALSPEHRGKIFELGGPRIFRMKQLMQWIAAKTGHEKFSINLPGSLIASLPFAPMSKDQVQMLRVPNIVSPNALTLHDLGIIATDLEDVANGWLVQYRQAGRFGVRKRA